VEALGRGDAAAGAVGRGAALIVGLALLQAGTRTLSRLALLGAGQRVEAAIRDDVYARLVALPPAFYLGQRTGDLMSRATNDLQSVVMLIGFGLLSVVNTVVIYAGVLAALLALDVTLTLAAVLPYPLLVGAARRFTTRIHAESLAAQEQLARLSAQLQENLAGMAVVRAYTMEAQEVAAFRRLNAEYLGRIMAQARTQGAFSPLMGVMGGVGALTVLWLGGTRVMDGRLSLGGLIAFSSYLAYLAWPTMALGWVLAIVRRGLTAMGRISEVLDAPVPAPAAAAGGDGRPTPGLAPEPVRGAVEFRRLTFAYQPDRPPALRDVSFAAPAGSTVAIVGPTGAGKTTLLQLLARLWEPPPGTVLVDGRDVVAWPRETLRAAIGYVPQEAFLFSRPLADNVLLGAPTDLLPGVARQSGLVDDVARLPEGWATVVGERGLTLSGGQRQRASLARALVRDPRILALDDAFASVDAAREAEILEALLAARAGRTTLFVTHRLAAAERADRVVVLEQGRVVEEGRHADLLARVSAACLEIGRAAGREGVVGRV
jgi:ATP-binding cassette subfamily B protein